MQWYVMFCCVMYCYVMYVMYVRTFVRMKFVRTSVRPYVRLYVCTYLSIYPYSYLWIYLSVCLSVCLSICLSICLFVYLFICLSIYLLTYLCIYVSMYLCIIIVYIYIQITEYIYIYNDFGWTMPVRSSLEVGFALLMPVTFVAGPALRLLYWKAAWRCMALHGAAWLGEFSKVLVFTGFGWTAPLSFDMTTSRNIEWGRTCVVRTYAYLHTYLS